MQADGPFRDASRLTIEGAVKVYLTAITQGLGT